MKAATSNKLGLISHPEFGQVRNVMIKGEPWFVANDVCAILGIQNPRDAMGRFVDDDEKGVGITDTLGGVQEMAIINESGMYSLIFQSRKPEARKFRKWVTSEVLPAIRRQGYYVDPSAQLSRAEVRKLENIMRKGILSYIMPKDIWDCHNKLRVSENTIRAVINGGVYNNAVMLDLQERAMINKERYENAYNPTRMQKVAQVLLNNNE